MHMVYACRQYSGVAHTDTEDEVTELSPNPALALRESPQPSINASSAIEDEWRRHVSDVMRDDNPEHALRTFSLFSRLFVDSSRRLDALTVEACLLLRQPHYIQQMAVQICILPSTISFNCCLRIRTCETLQYKFDFTLKHADYIFCSFCCGFVRVRRILLERICHTVNQQLQYKDKATSFLHSYWIMVGTRH